MEETQPAGLLESSRKPMDGCGGAALGDKAVRCSQIKPSAGSSWTCLYMHVLPLRNGTYILSRRPIPTRSDAALSPPELSQEMSESERRGSQVRIWQRSAPPRCSPSLRVYESSVGRLEPYWKSHLDTHTHTRALKSPPLLQCVTTGNDG